MGKKNFYAIRKGNGKGIYTSWEDCRCALSSLGGSEYKGFATEEEALRYLNHESSFDPVELSYDGVIAYVDGSYEHDLMTYSFGCVLITPDGEIYEKSGSGNNEESALLRNVTGEMLGAMFAVKWAMAHGYKAISIRYDYEGVEKWVNGAWKTNNLLTKKYSVSMNEWKKQIKIDFMKIAAHTNHKWNDRADRLAKDALTGDIGIPDFRS